MVELWRNNSIAYGVFWQKIKKGLLLLVVSLGFVLSLAVFVSNPVPAYAQTAAAPAATPAATTTPAATKAASWTTPMTTNRALNTGFASLVNLLILTATKVIQKFMELMAYLFSFAIEALKVVISYRGYATQKEVSSAWAITRDLVNSFFIVVLIAIALSTIIRFQQYNFRSTLPRLILAALLVNFSKTICLLAISFANSVMSTFSVALAEILPVYALGLRLPALTAFDSSTLNGLYDVPGALATLAQKPPVEMLTILVSAIVGALMMVFALGGIIMFLIILLFRIIVLWFLIILSPLAFFLWGVPGRASSYWGQWLDEFVKHLIVGPIGAFFLYIIAYFYVQNIKTSYGLSISANLAVPTLTQGVTPNILIGYLVSLGMMFISLEIIEQFGVRGGHFAREIGIDKIAAPFARGLRTIATAAPGVAGDWITSKTGIPLSPSRALEGITGGLTAKRERLAKDAMLKTAKTAKKLAGRGGLLGSLAPAYAYASGNEDLVKSLGVGDTLSFVQGAIPGTIEFQSQKTLTDNYTKVNNHQKARNMYDAMDTNIKNFVGGKTKAQLAESMSTGEIAKYKAYKNSKTSLPALQAQLSAAQKSLDTAGAQEAQAKIAAAQAAVSSYEGSYSETDRADLDQIASKEADIKKFQDSLGKDGVVLGENTKISDMKNREGELTASIGEMKRRQKFASLAVAGARSDLTSKMRDHTKETYERDVKYGTDDIYSNMLLNRDPKKRESFAGDLVKAGEMGKFDDILLKFGYDASPASVKKFADEVLQKELKFDEQEAMTILAEVQGRNAAANKVSQVYVKMDGVTQNFEFMSHEGEDGGAHAEAVENRIKNMGAFNALKVLKTDGLGYHDASKTFVANAGAIRGIKASGIKALIGEPGKLADIDAKTKREFLLANAGKLGLDAGEIAAIEKSLN